MPLSEKYKKITQHSIGSRQGLTYLHSILVSKYVLRILTKQNDSLGVFGDFVFVRIFGK